MAYVSEDKMTNNTPNRFKVLPSPPSYSREMPVNASAMENIVINETFSWKKIAIMIATITG